MLFRIMSAPATTASTSIPAATTGPVQKQANVPAASTPTPAVAAADLVIPTAQTLLQAARLAIQQDKRIMLDYYNDSLNEKAFIGEDHDTKERVLIKTRKDFTSLIQKILKTDNDYLVLTENSLYIVSAKTMKRRINLASLEYDYNDDE